MSDTLEMAVFFHETYERLAPSFGYETREGTKQFDPSSNNGRLMQTVCAAWLKHNDARIRELEAQLAAHEKVYAEMRALLVRYRTETPLGHQPHMIAHVVDELLDAKQPDGRSA